MMYKSILPILLVGLISACGGGSDNSSDNTTAGDTTAGGSTTGGTTTGGSTTGGTTTGGSTAGETGSGTVASIAGIWDATSTGDFGREEYWNISANGDFGAYVYTESARLFDAEQQVNFDVLRCFDPKIGTITAIGDNRYTIDGRFNESGFNDSYLLTLNADDTLQAAYIPDVVVCGNNGCSTQSVDQALPRVDSEFSIESLFACPAGPITSLEPLVTGATGATDGASWDCTFVDQDDRDQVATATVTFGSDGSGQVSGTRDFSWVSGGFNGVDVEANYTDGSDQFFTLMNIILYSTDDVVDRFTALDISRRISEDGGSLLTTYFEMDCSLTN